jgi:hypothetical protein
MSELAPRISNSRDLGRAHRWFDLLLGSSAVVPLLALAATPWVAPSVPALIVRTLSVIWGASLITFFAGVRRGLTFSERGGGRPWELITMLGLFAVGVFSLMFCSPGLAALGLLAVGGLDAVAGRRGEAPLYFTAFRPPQMILAAVALAVVQATSG